MQRKFSIGESIDNISDDDSQKSERNNDITQPKIKRQLLQSDGRQQEAYFPKDPVTLKESESEPNSPARDRRIASSDHPKTQQQKASVRLAFAAQPKRTQPLIVSNQVTLQHRRQRFVR